MQMVGLEGLQVGRLTSVARRSLRGRRGSPPALPQPRVECAAPGEVFAGRAGCAQAATRHPLPAGCTLLLAARGPAPQP